MISSFFFINFYIFTPLFITRFNNSFKYHREFLDSALSIEVPKGSFVFLPFIVKSTSFKLSASVNVKQFVLGKASL